MKVENLMSKYHKPLNDSYSVVSPVESGESENDGVASDIADEMDFSSLNEANGKAVPQ